PGLRRSPAGVVGRPCGKSLWVAFPAACRAGPGERQGRCHPESVTFWLSTDGTGNVVPGSRHRTGLDTRWRPPITWGVLRIGMVAVDQESGMKWRILVELAGADGSVQSHEISVGGCATIDNSAETLGLTLAEGKKTLAGLQRHLVQAQTEEHCRNRRRCQHCGAQRPLKDMRRRRLTSLFGVVEVRAPRFGPCRCGVASRRTITPAAEIMPDRCTPEYKRTLTKISALLPYRHARSLLEDFFPLRDAPEVETIRQRTLQRRRQTPLRRQRRPRRATRGRSRSPSGGSREIDTQLPGAHLRGLRRSGQQRRRQAGRVQQHAGRG